MLGGDHVVIAMGVCNGGQWMQAQLASITAQGHDNWSLIASDDQSTDDGGLLLAQFAQSCPGHDIQVVTGPGRGFARNFLSALARTGATPQASVALCDQDDVWISQRLEWGLDALSQARGRPMLYCARTMVCDSALRPLHISPRWGRPFSFANALVQNVAAGNTIMMNPQMAKLARAAAPAASRAGVIAHDWWLYQLATASGAMVVQDTRPVLYYRQHAANTMGRNTSLRARLGRARQLLDGTFAAWIDANRTALSNSDITPKAAALLHRFADLRAPGVADRAAALRSIGLYRQTKSADRALWLATLLGRL